VTNPDSAILILTFQPFLVSLVHTALSFQVDTTFKRVRGDLNEWEITIFYTGTNRSTCRSGYQLSAVLTRSNFVVVTIGRAYTNRANREYYHMLFDEVQKTVLSITSKPLRFKRLSLGDNLLAMGLDLEAAQVLGAGDSFLPTNEPEYNNIHTNEPDCPVLHLKSMLSQFI
jgi:hypothetical protein